MQETNAPITDEELTALALAADPDQEAPADAVPWSLAAEEPWHFLPAWYMPPVTTSGGRRWRVPVVVLVVAAMVVIEAFGLCITYGQLIAA